MQRPSLESPTSIALLDVVEEAVAAPRSSNLRVLCLAAVILGLTGGGVSWQRLAARNNSVEAAPLYLTASTVSPENARHLTLIVITSDANADCRRFEDVTLGSAVVQSALRGRFDVERVKADDERFGELLAQHELTEAPAFIVVDRDGVAIRDANDRPVLGRGFIAPLTFANVLREASGAEVSRSQKRAFLRDAPEQVAKNTQASGERDAHAIESE